VPAPTNYNDASLNINVDPDALWMYGATDLPAQLKAIGDLVGRVHDIWNGLQLGWAGTTADEAQDFADRWNGAVTVLFGTQADPQSSVLYRIAVAVQTASLNYATTEEEVSKMFLDFYDALPGGGGTNQPPTRDQSQGPITESAQW
jgi:hypothetical protein